MSKKRIRELEEQLARERAERMRLEQAHKNPKLGYRRMGAGPVPVAPPADFIQLTPIVQPVAFVPYSTQKQPLATFEDDYDDMY